MEDSQSSAGNSSQSSSNWVTAPPPLTLASRLIPDKRMHYSLKKDAIEDKVLQMIEKLEKKLDEDEMFCLHLAANLWKIQDP